MNTNYTRKIHGLLVLPFVGLFMTWLSITLSDTWDFSSRLVLIYLQGSKVQHHVVTSGAKSCPTFQAERSQCVRKLWIGAPPHPLSSTFPPSGSRVNDTWLKTAPPYGNNLPPPLTLFRFVSTTNAMATSRGGALGDEWPAGSREISEADVRSFWTSSLSVSK